MVQLVFRCPSCDGRLRPVTSSDSATQVVRRACRRCGERWRLTVRAVAVRDGARVDAADMRFIGRTRPEREEA